MSNYIHFCYLKTSSVFISIVRNVSHVSLLSLIDFNSIILLSLSLKELLQILCIKTIRTTQLNLNAGPLTVHMT